MSREEKISYDLLCRSMLKWFETPTTTDEHSSEVQNHSISRPHDYDNDPIGVDSETEISIQNSTYVCVLLFFSKQHQLDDCLSCKDVEDPKLLLKCGDCRAKVLSDFQVLVYRRTHIVYSVSRLHLLLYTLQYITNTAVIYCFNQQKLLSCSMRKT